MNDPHKVSDSIAPHSNRKRIVQIAVALLILVGVTLAVFYRYMMSGGLRARQTPTAFETYFAHKLVDMSIPSNARILKNPLDASASGVAVAVGRELYQMKCEACHGYDGNGNTAAGGGLYPPPANLQRSAVARRMRTDGELFYLIRNGVRNTGMPGWEMPDQQIWQLVSFIRNLPVTVPADAPVSVAPRTPAGELAHYVGSVACKKCHSAIYES